MGARHDSDDGTFDSAEALAVVGGDKELLSQMAGLFCAESPSMLSAIKQSLIDGDANALARAAHALKGSVGNFGKSESYRLASALEEKGRAGAMTGTSDQFLSLERTIARFEQDLRGFCG